MSNAEQKSVMTYSKVGGNYQLAVRTFEDLQAVMALDEAFWALNCIDVNSLRMDRRFLNFMDSNNDGKIRTDEVRTAVSFLLKYMKNGRGFEEKAAVLNLDDLNETEGALLLESARLILNNLGKPDARQLTLDELRNDKAIRSRSYNNGDGVVTPDPEQSPNVNARIELVMKTAGTADDVSGLKGINLQLLEKFTAEAGAFIAWDDQLANDNGTLLCFGANTAAVYGKYLAVKEDIDNYFLNSETLEFFSSEPERVGKKDLAADVRAPREVREMLEKSVLALPRADRTLDLNDKLNPLLRGKIEAFFALPEAASFLAERKLTALEWNSFKSKIAPYDTWSKAKPAFADTYAAAGKENLIAALNDSIMDELKTACANDLNAGTALAGIDMLHKLMLFQRYLKELLNNFVTLSALLDLHTVSPLQAGKLVMDGRHFTLAVPVTDLAEHKRIVAESNICVLYVDLSSTVPGVVPPFKTVAVAVTSGSMHNLFVGKRGLFFGVDGGIFDAKVTAFIDQPVSISEALKNPFYRFSSFVTEQINKFLNTKSAGAQKELGAQLSSGKVPPVPAAQNSGGNASMLLMSGGIGIAAIGSSIAFITKQLQNVSIWDILSVILGILLIFGGPVVIMSLIKLYRRDLSRFLEATGCAVNRKMRMCRKLGDIFTFTPIMPPGKKLRSTFVPRQVPGVWKARILWGFVTLIIAALCCGIWYMRGIERAKAAEKALLEAQKEAAVRAESRKKDCPSPKEGKAEVKKETAKAAPKAPAVKK